MTKIGILLLASWLPLTALAQPADVAVFEKNAGLCEHFAGEWDPDLPRADRLRIKKSMHRYCQRAKRQYAGLRYKYRTDAATLDYIESKAGPVGGSAGAQ